MSAPDPCQPHRGRFDGKVAFVTGAGSVGPGWGNGRAIAVRLAAEGARVFAVDRDLANLAETEARAREAGGTLHAAAGDVTDGAAIAARVADGLARFGRIDVLVNDVGGSAKGGPVAATNRVSRLLVALRIGP